MGRFENDSIFWVEVDKIIPNPYQPRRDFDEERLNDLAESIRTYGVLQPLTVTRNEKQKENGGLTVEYELIAGERRHRAAQIAGLQQVPVIIRSGQETSKMKLELAIIENLQREDLNPVERAQAFNRLNDEFDFTHTEIAKKIGKSREYVSNSIRLLTLPDNIQKSLMAGKITEGHARPIMMLRDKPEEQQTLFKEIIYKGLTVRESEEIARRIAKDKVRKKTKKPDPEVLEYEDKLSDSFGTRVQIKRKEDKGGKVIIDFFSDDDLKTILDIVSGEDVEVEDMMDRYIKAQEKQKEEENQEATQGQTQSEKESKQTLSSAIAEKQESESDANTAGIKNKDIDDEEDDLEQSDQSADSEEQSSEADQKNAEKDIDPSQKEKIAELISAHFSDGGEAPDAEELSRKIQESSQKTSDTNNEDGTKQKQGSTSSGKQDDSSNSSDSEMRQKMGDSPTSTDARVSSLGEEIERSQKSREESGIKQNDDDSRRNEEKQSKKESESQDNSEKNPKGESENNSSKESEEDLYSINNFSV